VGVEFRVVGSADETILAEMFHDVDETFFRPHPFTGDEARRIASDRGQDVHAVLVDDGRAVAYGMLRGLDEAYPIPTLGICVRTSAQGRGLGRLMMAHLHAEAARLGATIVRLRVHPDNTRARLLYESVGYAYAGDDRGELAMFVDLESRIEHREHTDGPPLTITAALLDVNAPAWDATLRTSRHDFYHLPAYVALCAAETGGRPCALYVIESGRAVVLPLIIRDIVGGGFDATSPYGYPGPVGKGTEDPGFLRVALAAGRETLRAAGIVSAFIRLHPLLNTSPPNGVGTLVRHGETVSIDLTLSTEELWAQTRLNHRRDISRSLRLGYTARMDEEWRHLESFKRLYQGTMNRRAAVPFYFFGDTYFDGLRAALGDRLHLCIVERDGAIAAAGLFVETNGIVQYHLSGSDAEFIHAQPTKLMLHFVRGWAKERGNRVLHLGGGVAGADDSLMQFKVGFSTTRHSFDTLRMVLDEPEYRRLVLARDPLFDPDPRHGYFPTYRIP
jgi:GNAT superfamily N-acetyltransferase